MTFQSKRRLLKHSVVLQLKVSKEAGEGSQPQVYFCPSVFRSMWLKVPRNQVSVKRRLKERIKSTLVIVEAVNFDDPSSSWEPSNYQCRRCLH